jgi:RND family efflux transporter MFP subunit
MRYFALALLFSLLAACQKPVEPPAPPRPALVIKAGANSSDTAMALVGEVRPRYESAQGFRIAGKIIQREVETGSMVRKGQVLVRLDAADTGLNAQAAQADVKVAEADLALAQSELDRQRKLYNEKFISASALDNREAQFKSASARAQQVRAQAAVSGNQSRYATLTADRDGVVTDIHAEPGQVVQAGEIIARIADPRQLEVVIAVPESRMTGVKPGESAVVRMWATRDHAYKAKVREVAPAADTATRTFQVKVSILDIDQSVRQGMTAGVRFADEQDSALLLPTSAVTQRDGKPVIWLVNPQDHTVRPREVSIGQFREDGVLITSGLTAGELVVVAGVHTLVPGQTVVPKQVGVQP